MHVGVWRVSMCAHPFSVSLYTHAVRKSVCMSVCERPYIWMRIMSVKRDCRERRRKAVTAATSYSFIVADLSLLDQPFTHPFLYHPTFHPCFRVIGATRSSSDRCASPFSMAAATTTRLLFDLVKSGIDLFPHRYRRPYRF